MNTNSYDMPMKWHKFLIYFSLWAGAILCVASAIQLLTGSVYGADGTAEQVYRVYGGLKSVDSIFGVLYLITAALLIYVRFQLAGFKEGAPNKLTIAYVVQLAAFLGYMIAVSSTIKRPIGDLANSQTLTSIVSSVVMIIVNRIYYNKRAHLFGNAAAVSGAPHAASSGVSNGFCPMCGAKVEPDDAFCVNCGAKIKE